MRTKIFPYTRLLSLLLIPALLLLAACTDRTPDETQNAPSGIEVPPPAAPPVIQAADTIQVILSDYQIDMPTSLAPGPVVFAVYNEGTVPHAFEVESGEMEERLDPIEPGDMQHLSVELAAGRYTVYCPVDNHRERGMTTGLLVSDEAPGTL
ncbi:MAG: hypothetical protein KatS3mg043_2009 [Rhodothermaceae bacterium]|nr:MAG: hypothetical protein KatS3mg043_2009 [Rhodothermaceae bacterium]